MSCGPSDDLVTYRFHALVTLDENNCPYGEASTDPDAVLSDGQLTRSFSCISADGFGVASVAFEIQVPREQLIIRRNVVKAELIAPERQPSGIIKELPMVIEAQKEPSVIDNGSWLEAESDDDFEEFVGDLAGEISEGSDEDDPKI